MPSPWSGSETETRWEIFSCQLPCFTGRFIVIPQDQSPLLRILPSPELRLTDLIKVIWLGKQPPVDSDLRPFLLVRKHRVMAALQYLVDHNPLYRDVLIDHSAVDGWADDFVPPELSTTLSM